MVKNLSANAGDAGDKGSIPGSRGSPGEGNGHPLQYSNLGNPHGQRSLAGYCLWGHKESDITEHEQKQAIYRVIKVPQSVVCRLGRLF